MRKLNSLFFKTFAVFFVSITICIVVLESIAFMKIRPNSEYAMAQEGATVSRLLSMQIGGSVKFENTAALEAIAANLAASAKSAWVGTLVTDVSGQQMLFRHVSDGADSTAYQALAAEALETNSVVTTEDGLIVAEPIYFGGEDVTVGAVVTEWSADHLVATTMEAWFTAVYASVGVLVAMLLMTGFVIRSTISQPLTRLEGAVGAVADGNYTVDVPHADRGDEVGRIATRLEQFKNNLQMGERAKIDSAYKSAAFEGTTSSMMVVNNDLDIIYSNTACADLFAEFEPELKAVWPDLTLPDLTGVSLKGMSLLSKDVERILSSKEQVLPLSTTIAVGDHRLRVKFNAARDADGKMTGAIVEWSERTDAIQKAAIVEAIDSAQVRAEFSQARVLMSANDNFLTCTGCSTSDIGQLSFDDLFMAEGSSDADPLSQEVVSGRFKFHHKSDGAPRFTDGSFVAVQGLDGRPEKSVFVGMDVTQVENARQDAEQQRRNDTEAQERVVEALGAALHALAGGDLTKSIAEAFPAEYEQLRDNFNSAVSSLAGAMEAVARNTASIRSETGEITSAADDLSRRTERQAATLEETAAALDELTSSVRSAAKGAQGASDQAKAAQAKAEESGKVARQAVSAMDRIKNSSQEISKITSVIDDIAFQTNLLALNAGVEAARAGDAGRGFAVVATEVRALAQRSSDAASEINELISSSEAEVISGVELVDKTGTALAEIVTSIADISSTISQIAVSTQEQSSGLNEINTAMTDLDQVTQQNAAMFEETTAASHALTSEAQSLAAAVSRFKINSSSASVGDSGTEQAAPHAKPAAAASEPKAQERAPAAQQAIAVGQSHSSGAEFMDDSGWEDF